MSRSEEFVAGQATPVARMHPKSKDGHDLYPQASPDYDSMPYEHVTSHEDVERLLSKKTAHRYDDERGFVRTPIHEWHLDRDRQGTTVIPAGYKFREGHRVL
jgi:hypothetical protein